jgi:uncharacterized membrane protein YhaH (DUF805 family)
MVSQIHYICGEKKTKTMEIIDEPNDKSFKSFLNYYFLDLFLRNGNYFNFDGTLSKKRFWMGFLCMIVANSLLYALFCLLFGGPDGWHGFGKGLYTLCQLALFIPFLAAEVRRLHDTGKTGYWVLLELIPVVGWILVIIMLLRDPGYYTQPGHKDI